MINEVTGELDAILADDWRFKESLGIGEETYQFLKQASNLERFLGVAGATAGGVYIASSAIVAETFFPSTGLFAALGLGATAATPIGWVLAAGALTGGAYYGLSRLIDAMRNKGTIRIPKYINTPLDVIADQLLGLMLPLSIWIAMSDDKEISDEERNSIGSYYADNWGYEQVFVERAIAGWVKRFDTEASTMTAKGLAKSLSEYCAGNKDCNKNHIMKFLVDHLNDLVEMEENQEYRERKSRAAREFEKVALARSTVLSRFFASMRYRARATKNA